MKMKLGKNSRRFLVSDGILFVIFNVISFAVPFAKSSVFWISYVFGIIAILVQVAVMKIAFSGTDTARSKFYGFPIARIGVVYAIVQIILSILFMALSALIPFWIPLVLFVILLGISAIGFIAADATRDEIVRQDEKIVKDVSFMRNLQSKMNLLVEQCENPDLKKQVKSLAEDIRYSDPVSNNSLNEIERELYFYIEDLQKAVVDNDENAFEICKKAKTVLAERNRLCKLNKNKV